MKICIKCSLSKPLEDFYKHDKSKDGFLNECKSCVKLRVKNRESKLRNEDPEWVDKEKTRAREKYHRLQYKDIHKPTKEMKKKAMARYKAKYPEKIKAKLRSQHMKPQIPGNELHHWSYNEQHYKDVIELDHKVHAMIHCYMVYDGERMMYRRSDNNELLYTREVHQDYINYLIETKTDKH